MTAAARITQADMERAAKAVANAGWRSARIIIRLDKGEIEILASDQPVALELAAANAEGWSDDEV